MITLLANPTSRSGRGKRLWPLWRRTLEQANRPHAFLATASNGDCMEKAAQAATGGGIVTAVGGDGTINAVIDGIMRASTAKREADMAPGGVALGVLYAGTSPDFCRFHGLPLEAEQAAQVIIAGETRPIDIAALCCEPEAGTAPRRHFASSCNIGLGADTARMANSWRRYFGDVLGTGLGLVRAMLTHKPFLCHLTVDGETLEFARANHVVILKNPHIASGIRVNLPVAADDGFMHIIVIHDHSRLELLRLVRSLYTGDWAHLPKVFIRQCRTVELTAAPVQAIECDGDPCGLTPVTTRVLPKAVRLVCPASHQGEPHA